MVITNVDTQNLFNERSKVCQSIFPNGNVKGSVKIELLIFNRFLQSRFVLAEVKNTS